MKLKVKNIDLLSPIYSYLYRKETDELVVQFVELVKKHLNIVNSILECDYDKLNNAEFIFIISQIYDIYLDKNDYLEIFGKELDEEYKLLSNENNLYPFIIQSLRTNISKKKLLKGIKKYVKRLDKSLKELYKDSIDDELDNVLDKSIVILDDNGINQNIKQVLVKVKEDSKNM